MQEGTEAKIAGFATTTGAGDLGRDEQGCQTAILEAGWRVTR